MTRRIAIQTMLRASHVTFTALLLTMVGGCAISSGDQTATLEMPHTRLGALPFPGILTLYQPTGLGDLGTHHYKRWEERPLERLEGARGIMYTRDAGFIDLAHLRESVDWTRYLAFHCRRLLDAGGGTFAFESEETTYQLVVSPPTSRSVSNSQLQNADMNEAAIRIGQRFAYSRAVWHEVMTWHGWCSVLGVSEQRSAFTWDDLTSDLLGTIIGGNVIREAPPDFDLAAERLIRETLASLDPIPRREVDGAAFAVENIWWSGESPLRRDLETGLDLGSKTPWLIPSDDPSSDIKPRALPVAVLADIDGIDWRGQARLLITPPVRFRTRIAPLAPPGPLDSELDLADIVGQVRREMERQWGPDCHRPDRPVPGVPAHETPGGR